MSRESKEWEVRGVRGEEETRVVIGGVHASFEIRTDRK